MTIAIPVENGVLSKHLWRCDCYALFDVNPETAALGTENELVAPPHAPGVLPGWLAQMGADVVIAGGMGSRARHLFEYHGLRVVLGADCKPPAELATAYLDGSLISEESSCTRGDEPCKNHAHRD